MVTGISLQTNSYLHGVNLRFGRFQMEGFSYQNKVRLCSAIFTALIFLDIIAFFDTLNPILSFSKRHKGSSMPVWQNHDIERENISRQNYTRSYKSEEKKEEEAVAGEILSDVALLLVDILGLAILLVAKLLFLGVRINCTRVPCSRVADVEGPRDRRSPKGRRKDPQHTLFCRET